MNPENIFYHPYIVELIGGLITAVFTFVVIWNLRPRMKISPNIAMITKNGQPKFSIKVINRSYVFQLIDVKFELTKLKPNTTPK